MKKVLLAAMILLAGASFTSCSSSDDDDNEKQEQKFDASKVMSGKWKLSKIQDFPIPINHYSIQKGNTISFLDGGILRTEGDFSVVINGDADRPMTMPFGSYKTWKADTTYKHRTELSKQVLLLCTLTEVICMWPTLCLQRKSTW